MIEFLSAHQLNIMLALSSVCATIALFVLIANALPKRRRMALLFHELASMFLLYFDRLAYMYSGDQTQTGFVMVRVTNFFVFALTNVVVLTFNQYITDILMTDGKLTKIPRRIKVVNALTVMGVFMVVVSQFTGIYYYFDELNTYHRGPLFILCYVFPVVAPLIQLTVIVQNKKRINRGIYISLVLFVVVPILASIVQIFAYGLSLTNIAIVGLAVVIYIFALFDINERIQKASQNEIEYLKKERKNMQRLFDQTASAFVGAVDARDEFTKGHSQRVAKYAREIARACGKSEKECDEVYYAALLHDVGKLGIPDALLQKTEDLTKEEKEIVKRKTIIGDEILSNITDYPYLRFGAHYVHEKFDGSGYPEHLKGYDIPEIARIVAVADRYDFLTSSKADRDPFPQFVVREEFIKESGARFDPRFASIMVALMDKDGDYEMQEYGLNSNSEPETEFSVDEYRSHISKGILVEPVETEISFEAVRNTDDSNAFSNPSIIVFDSFDGRVHEDEKTIQAFGYTEFGEIWFDGRFISTRARNMEINVIEEETDPDYDEAKELPENKYYVYAGRYEDHVKVRLVSRLKTFEVVIALLDNSVYAYVGLTGEHCDISNIEITKTEKEIEEIPRIAQRLVYTNRLEGDIPNVQIDRTRSAATKGVPVQDEMRLIFHSMSLPSSTLVWQCPYVVLYNSDDGEVYGENYHEYSVVKLNGENDAVTDYALNEIEVEKTEDFGSWEAWKTLNKKGIECEVKFTVEKGVIITEAETGGIILKNTTRLKEDKEVYVALTGDQCALTDIRIKT